jgi:hypothetical protein
MRCSCSDQTAVTRPQTGCATSNICAKHGSRSPRVEADAAHAKAKTEMLQLRLMEKRKELVRQADVDALVEDMVGTMLTALSSMPARCAPRGDLATRRAIEKVVFEVRTEMANVAHRKADECGEPPLSE